MGILQRVAPAVISGAAANQGLTDMMERRQEHTWQPILTGKLAEQARQAIEAVAERLMMRLCGSHGGSLFEPQNPYYYVLDRMYGVSAIVDRAGAMVERYAYGAYGRPLIRESCGRGDMDNDTDMHPTVDGWRVKDAAGGDIWDPRADMDDDGDVDATNETLYETKDDDWPPQTRTGPTVGPAIDTVLAVYSGACGALTELACNDDALLVCGRLSEVCVSGLTPGTTYYIQAASFSDFERGPITMDVTCPCP